MKNQNCKQLLIGLVNSGKTTFLAALWHAIDSPGVNCSLTLNKLFCEDDHLNKIRDNWIKCLPVDRTIRGAETKVFMRLSDNNSGKITELCLPDLSGELFKAQWAERFWEKEYDELVKSSKGAILFIHPDNIKHPDRIDSVKDLDIPDSEKIDGEPLPFQHADIAWDIELSPTQVILVDHLQFIEKRLGNKINFKIVIIISAWDLITEVNAEPHKWLSSRLPLLHQYLISNNDIFPFRVYGISAQGGKYEEEGQTELLEILDPAKRIRVVGYNSPTHDIANPIKWLMD